MSTYETFLIPEQRITELRERVAKLNKKATKLGTPPIDLIVTDEKEEKVVHVGGTMALRMGQKFSYTAVKVLLRGETPKLNGWEFLAVVLHRPAGNEIINAADAQADVSAFQYTDKHCDHCHKNRVRNATFLVRHTDGQIKQVGSTCLEDYTGVKSPQAVARQMENIFDLFRELRGGGWVTGRTSRKFFLVEWMAFVNMAIRERGFYVSRSRAYDLGESTTGEVAKRAILRAADDANAPVPTDADFALAEKQIAWGRTMDAAAKFLGMGDYGQQLHAVVEDDTSDAVPENAMNIVAPLAAFYARHAEESTPAASTAQGQAKERITRVLKVTRTFGYETEYGWTHGYEFIDREGNVYVWKASKNQQLEVGTCYRIQGTVKDHSEFRGVTQTNINRCKVVATIGRAA